MHRWWECIWSFQFISWTLRSLRNDEIFHEEVLKWLKTQICSIEGKCKPWQSLYFETHISIKFIQEHLTSFGSFKRWLNQYNHLKVEIQNLTQDLWPCYYFFPKFSPSFLQTVISCCLWEVSNSVSKFSKEECLERVISIDCLNFKSFSSFQ